MPCNGTSNVFRGKAVPRRAKKQQSIGIIFFTQIHLMILNIKKTCISKFFIKMFIKRKTRAEKAYAYQMLLSFED